MINFLEGSEGISFEVRSHYSFSGDDADDVLSFAFESAPLPYNNDDNVLASSPSIGAVFEGNRESDDNDCWFKFELED